jgi:hypothetical protein
MLSEGGPGCILISVGLLLTRTAEEDGGREKRRQTAAIRKAAYKQAHPEMEQDP